MSAENFVLILFTAAAWAIHSAIASLYVSRLNAPKSLAFRLINLAEISIVVTITLIAYKHFINPNPEYSNVVLTILGTLVVLDCLLLIFVKPLREKLDLWQFLAVYIAIAILTALLILLVSYFTDRFSIDSHNIYV